MPKYVVNSTQRRFIVDNFYQWSFDRPDGYQPDKELFLQISHPAELHYLSDIYNWDDGVLVLEWLLDSSLCTRATANLLFWRCPRLVLKMQHKRRVQLR